MTQWDELRIYLHYHTMQLSLKHDFIIRDKSEHGYSTHRVDKDNNAISLPWNHGWGEPDAEVGRLAFYYLWKNIGIMTFEQFKTEGHWGESKLQNWYSKFKHEIEL